MPREARLNPLVRSGPDIDGWREAQDRLITSMGVSVEFRTPSPKVYAPNVAVDPETGVPYDPTIVPVSGGEMATDLVVVSPVFRSVRPANPTDPIFQNAAGVMRDENAALIIREMDYPIVQFATEFTLFEIDYKLTEIIADGLVGRDRYVAFGEAL